MRSYLRRSYTFRIVGSELCLVIVGTHFIDWQLDPLGDSIHAFEIRSRLVEAKLLLRFNWFLRKIDVTWGF